VARTKLVAVHAHDFNVSYQGRSGDIAAVQPKAAGSSLMVQLTNLMALDALHIAGMSEVRACLTVPLCTGMSLALTLLGLRLK
jgi:O-phospho-L-seryl-tRNASec:L-selenocysteinyl-tRNA synthase